jgi:phage tail protein X
MAAAATLFAGQGDTLDGLLWRERGMGPADWPAVFALNPELASHGAILPAGLVVAVPATSAAAPILEIIQLWD